MGSDVYDLLDELAARGRRLLGQLPGDYKPIEEGDPASAMLMRLHGLLLNSWPAVGEELRWEEDAR